MILEATLACAEYGYPKGSPNTCSYKEEIGHYSSQYIACPSTHPNNLVVNLMEQPDRNR
jgi:hypothetical protein